MSSAQIREPASFGKRKEPHSIVITKNGRSRTFRVNPLFFSIGMCFVFTLLVGYLSATAYLIFRDDLFEASFVKQARIQHEYEDRIAALRSKLDRVTSRQLLDQQQIEAQVSQLMARQQTIGSQSGRMGGLLEKAKKHGLSSQTSVSVPVPSSNPQKSNVDTDNITTGSINIQNNLKTADASSLFVLRGSSSNSEATNIKPSPTFTAKASKHTFGHSRFTNELFGEVAEAITIIDAKQREEIDGLRIAAAKRTEKISNVLKSVGAPVPSMPTSHVGGPFVPLDHSVDFDVHLQALEDTLQIYDQVSTLASSLPLKNPIPGAQITSRYGSRVDPFNGRTAMHGGIDFRAKTGTAVRATGGGKVIKAGRSGGYGKLVEIKHSNGLSTRYAHLSRINVKKGQYIKGGQVIGKVGSTGRSTGPHLHYEVRRSGKTRNPASYLKSGNKINGLI